jgi:hypothetical protein
MTKIYEDKFGRRNQKDQDEVKISSARRSHGSLWTD